MSKPKQTVKAEKPPQTTWNIESDVPIPPRASGKRDSKYPWASLDVGDSFTFSADDPAKTAKQFSSTCYSAGRRLGKKFTVRAETDSDGSYTGTVRVWRKS